MRIDRCDLPDDIDVYACKGRVFNGPAYADAVTMRARVELGFRKVLNSQGQEVVIDGTMFTHPNDATPHVGDRVGYEVQMYTVVSVVPIKMDKHVHHYEVGIKSLGSVVKPSAPAITHEPEPEPEPEPTPQVVCLNISNATGVLDEAVMYVTVDGSPEVWHATTLAQTYAEWDSEHGGNREMMMTGWTGEIPNGEYGVSLSLYGFGIDGGWRGNVTIAGSTVTPDEVTLT